MLNISAIRLHQVQSLAAQAENLGDSLAEAIAQGDPERAAGLVLAARLQGKGQIDAQQLIWLLQRFEDPLLVPCLVGACPEPLEPLAQCIPVHPEQSVIVSILLVLGVLLEGQKVPDVVVRPARRFLRKTPFSSTSPLVAAVRLLDNGLLYASSSACSDAAVRKWEPLVECFRRCLAGDFRSLLTDPANFQPVRRSSPKVGRNDPCPCGSGAKFKKCCQDKVAEAVYEAWVQPKSFHPRRLDLHQLVQLDWEDLDSPTLELTVEELSRRGPLDLAVKGFKALTTRVDFRDEAEDFLKIFLLEFRERAKRLEVVALLEWFTSEFDASGWVELMRFALKAGGKRLEGWFREIVDEPGQLADWASCVRPYRPALSILFTRASFRKEMAGLEWDLHLDGISEARLQLGLDEYDAFHSIAHPFGKDDEDEESLDQEELQTLRQELESAGSQLRNDLEARPEPITQIKTDLVDLADPQVELLQSRVNELEQLLQERNEERARLRSSLQQQTTRTEPSLFPPPPEDEDTTIEPESNCESYRPLEPVFSKAAQQQLRDLPTATARQGLRLIGELSAGTGPAWVKCQRLQQSDDLYSTRLGREYRLLFRVDEKAGQLRIEQMVHRSQLERAMKGS